MIYVVLQQSYEYTEIIGVYDKKELADEVLTFNKEYYVQECELNKLTESGMNYVFSYIRELKEKLNIEEEN
jgi:hypothetical protein